jgi:hypothetical protein
MWAKKQKGLIVNYRSFVIPNTKLFFFWFLMNIFLLFSTTFESINGSYFLMFFPLKIIWTAINKNAKNMFIVSNYDVSL